MSAQEDVPTGPDAWDGWSDEDREQWLQDAFDEFGPYWVVCD
jgi:hypothetical protein